MGLMQKVDVVSMETGQASVESGPRSASVWLRIDGQGRAMSPDQARRLGRALLQHAARLSLSAGRNLTGEPNGSAVDSDGSTG